MDNIQSIRNFLTEDYNRIITLLENTNFYNISYREYSNQIRCSKYPDSSINGVEIYCDTLYSIIYSTNIRGDIFQIIMEHNHIGFSELVSIINNLFKLDNFYYNKKELFGGFYKKFKKYHGQKEEDEQYDISILNNYIDLPMVLFQQDGIDASTQKKFNVRYDILTNRICVPWFNKYGKIVGIEGRINKKDIDDGIAKWFPVIPFKKSNFLYGFYQNYSDIIFENDLYIFESTKSVMKCNSFGIKNCCACGGNNLSIEQVNMIYGTYISNVVICFDEDITETHIRNQCKKLTRSFFYKKNVFYIYDEDNKYLKKGSKDSPIDCGKDNFIYLLKNSLKKYNENEDVL